ncbi:MAG TPA: hypothetical protein VFK05_25560 [Polyangiaceae bacterium]|nr:hypothetical protein [Polyangiaceae bacterium]
MKTVLARALVALTLVVLPTSALASAKGEPKADKTKHETKTDKHGQAHASVAKKEHSPKKAKHRGRKAKDAKGITAAAPVTSASKAP